MIIRPVRQVQGCISGFFYRNGGVNAGNALFYFNGSGIYLRKNNMTQTYQQRQANELLHIFN